MKCTNCGAELKVGCIYCSVCGHEAQIVPDYNILEDDLLKSLLEEDNKSDQKTSKQEKKQQQRPETSASNQSNDKKAKKKKSKLPIIILFLVLFLIVVLISVFALKNNRNNSFDYQYQQGINAESEKDYSSAIRHLVRASELKKDNIDVYMHLASVYEKTEDKKSEEAYLLQALKIDDKNADAYKMLIALYDSEKHYNKISDLQEKLKDDTKLSSLFEAYTVDEPTFSEDAGNYTEELQLEITAPSGCDIYYALDYKDPVLYGKKYDGPIDLKEGKTVLSVVAKDDRGFYSSVVTKEYVIQYQAPAVASVSPGRGTYTEAQAITINVPAGCTAYYTWDGSDPTTQSSTYAGPLEMPAGNNVLSILLVDGHGLSSNIIRYNYVYLP